jgi:hypothetical protein
VLVTHNECRRSSDCRTKGFSQMRVTRYKPATAMATGCGVCVCVCVCVCEGVVCVCVCVCDGVVCECVCMGVRGRGCMGVSVCG